MPPARPAGERAIFRIGPYLGHAAAVLLEKVGEHFLVDIARIVVADVRGIALAAMALQAGIKLARPRHAAFEEGEIEAREALRHATEHERLGEGLASGGEAADVVVHIVMRGDAAAVAGARRMARHRHFELLAFGPDRIVIV